MIEHSFYIKGSHRQATVIANDILSAANDAAWLLNVVEHEQLLWLPPLPPLVRQATQSTALGPIERVTEPSSEGTDTKTIVIDLVGMGRTYFPIFLQNAEQYWRTFQESKESDSEAMARYCIMLCGAIDAISSVEALEQIRVHVWRTSGMPQELMAPTLDVALEQLVSIQARFLAPYDRRAFRLFLCVLAFACLAVPIEQGALDRLRDCLTVVERQCSAFVEGMSYSAHQEDMQVELVNETVEQTPLGSPAFPSTHTIFCVGIPDEDIQHALVQAQEETPFSSFGEVVRVQPMVYGEVELLAHRYTKPGETACLLIDLEHQMADLAVDLALFVYEVSGKKPVCLYAWKDAFGEKGVTVKYPSPAK